MTISLPLPIRADEAIATPELVERLIKGKRLSPAAARQQIKRASAGGPIWRSEYLQLPSRARLFAQRPFVGQAPFLAKIEPVLRKTRPGICRLIRPMLEQKAIHLDTVKKLLAAPLDEQANPGLRSFAEELLVLQELGIGLVDRSGGGAPRLIRPMLFDTDESRTLGYELAGKHLLDQQLTSFLFRDFQKQNQIAWGSASSADTEHIFNGQWFSAHGYSWLRPLRHFRDGKPIPCPTVFDVRADAAKIADVEAFCARIKRAGDRPRSKLRLLGVMAARFFEPAAFALGKEYGLAMVNLQQSIGDEALETLAAIDKILSLDPTGGQPSPDPAADYVDLFKKLRFHPQAKNLASLAFEALSASVIQANGWTDVRTNLAVPFQATSRDVDVSGRRGDHYIVIECKAHAGTKPIERRDVVRFFKETVPSFLKYMAPRQPVRTLQAEMWTTGQVPAECFDMLEPFETELGIHDCTIRTADKIEVPNHISSMRPLLQCIADL